MKANFKSIIMLLVIVMGVLLAVSMFSNSQGEEDAFVYSDLKDLFNEDLVTSFVVDESGIITVKALDPIRDEFGAITGYKTDKDGKRVGFGGRWFF